LGRQIDIAHVKHYAVGLEFLENVIEQGTRPLAALKLSSEERLLTIGIKEIPIVDALPGALGKGASIQVPAANVRVLDPKDEGERDAEGPMETILQ
jgi:hypothetical protein